MATKKTASRKPHPVKKKAKTTRKPAAPTRAAARKPAAAKKPAGVKKTAAGKRAAIAAARRALGDAHYQEVAAVAKSMLAQGKPTHVVTAAVDRKLKGSTAGVDALYIIDCLA